MAKVKAIVYSPNITTIPTGSVLTQDVLLLLPAAADIAIKMI